MAKHAHTGSRPYCYTVHNLCICPRRLFTTTVYSHCQCPTTCSLLHCTQSLWKSHKTIPYYTVHNHCHCPTRPFPTTDTVSNKKILYYTVHSVSVQQDQQDHSLLHSTLYTLTVCVQQENSLLHCTHSLSVSNKKIPYYTVHTHCLCLTKPFQTI